MLSVVLNVRDVSASTQFYTEVLGFSGTGPGLPGPDGREVFGGVLQEGTMVMLDATSSPPEHVGRGVTLHVTMPDDFDLDGLYERIRAQQVPVIEPLGDKFWGERVFSVTDPDGYVINVARKIFDASFDDMASITARGE